MSIDAVVDKVEYGPAGATLHLRGREPGEPPGQSRMTVIDPPPGLESLEGVALWGGATCLMVGERRLFERVGYTRLRLTSKGRKGD